MQMVSSGEHLDELASDDSQKTQSADNGCHVARQNQDNKLHVSQKQEKVASDKSLQDPNASAGVRISQLDKEGSISSLAPSKVSLTPGNGSSFKQSGQEGRTPIVREKVSEDGYHWRKYGQKLVKGNEFIRSYYKCTHPTCQVKKQLERSHDGQVVDVVYFGPHHHPKPEHNVPLAVGFVLSVLEEKAGQPLSTSKEENPVTRLSKPMSSTQTSTVASSEDLKGALSGSTRIRDEVDTDDDQRYKRQKKGNFNVEPNPVDKPSCEQRLVVQTRSEVDIVNDGYRWRKYGQKLVKGNPNPRSYYRCSSPGCPAKKHVERASHDSKVVITSYEGKHDHDMPPSRTVTHNATGLNNYPIPVPGRDPGAKPGGCDGVRRLDPGGNSEEQCDESRKASKGSHVSSSDIIISSGPDHHNKSNELQNSESIATEGSESTNGTGEQAAVDTSSVSEGRSSEQLDKAPVTTKK